MTVPLPAVPMGSARHPIVLVVLSAADLRASATFYASVFGWQTFPMSADLTAVVTPGGPTVSLRSNMPAGFPGMVPFIGVPNVADALTRVVAAGAHVERAPWTIPMVGTLARFRDASGTIYGLTDSQPPNTLSHMPMPFGGNPRPPAGAICSLEMYAAPDADAAAFFREQFGWGAAATMPAYTAFDPGAGVGGVFQSHTPAEPALAYIYTVDVATTLSAIEKAGGTRRADPMRIPGMGCFGYFTDPSGTHMGLIGG